MCLDEGFESAMTVMPLPKYLRKYFRTSNHIERLNKELKRRSSVIGIFPNESSLLRLMGSVLLERNDVLNARRAIFSPAAYAALIKSSTVTDLRQLAEEQQKLRQPET
jgi:putative transposase